MNPKLQAVSLFRTWLDKCNIPYTSNGESLNIKTVSGDDIVVACEPRNVMSTDLGISIAEFHKFTSAAGYGTPLPVNRGAAPKKRMFADSILARWRHNEMRTVPNAPVEELKSYSDIAVREARIFVSRNRHLCAEMGYDVDIASNDALIWTNTFIGRYKLRDDAEKGNRKLLTNYLRQRFKEMRDGLRRERRNVIPADSYGDFVESVLADSPGEEWMERHNELGGGAGVRRKKAKELLAINLSKMSHPTMIETLQEVIDHHPCFDTRKAANKFLKDHAATCDLCKDVGKSNINE